MAVPAGQTRSKGHAQAGLYSGCVLTGNEIKKQAIISENFSDKCLRPTTYDLRLGNEFMVPHKGDGTSKLLLGSSPLVIAKFSSVIVSTHELVRLPGNVTGKFNLKIKMALRGLFVQMGTQVEPNYHGRLFALLQNISDEEIVIEPQSETNKLFAIEFYYTSSTIPKEASDFRKGKIDRIGQFIQGIAFSGTINNITTEIEERLGRLEAANTSLNADMKAIAGRLEDVTPQINQATERLFNTKSLIIGAALLSALAIIVSVVAPVVAKIILDSTSEQSRPIPAVEPVLSSSPFVQTNSNGLQAGEREDGALPRLPASRPPKTTRSPADRAPNQSKDHPQ